MADAGRPGSPTPTTPSKRRETLENVISKLNVEYNIGLPRSRDLIHLSPRKQKERASTLNEDDVRCETIRKRLQVHFYDRGGSLDHVLRAFDTHAKIVCKSWIHKPRADPRTLPRPSHPPQARNDLEQRALQQTLLDVLDEAKPSLLAPRQPRSFTRTQSAPVGHGNQAGSRENDAPWNLQPKAPKRQSAEGLVPSPKRPKSRAEQSVAPRMSDSIVDRVPVRPKVGADGSFSTASQLDAALISNAARPTVTASASVRTSTTATTASYSTSANTSKFSIASAVFSVPDHDPPSNSQTTIEASSQENKRLPPLSSSQDVFPLSSGEARALNESFSIHEAAMKHDGAAPKTPPHKLLRSSQSPSTMYSGVTDIADADVVMADAGQACAPDGLLHTPPFAARLKNIWPKFPASLDKAPFAVAWEVTRVALHCGVDLSKSTLRYTTEWNDLATLWRALYTHDDFRGKDFPEKCSAEAWTASMNGFRNKHEAVVLSASLDFTSSKCSNPDVPLFAVQLQPLKLELGCRINRRFGSDRCLELSIPSLNVRNVPKHLKSEEITSTIVRWLASERHNIVGRRWASFFTVDGGHKVPKKEVQLGPEPQPVFRERVFLFAEDGVGFSPKRRGHLPPKDEPVDARTGLSVKSMLHWLLDLNKNDEQPYLKLISRNALGLSKTIPVVVLEKHQIRNIDKDLKSPTDKVMNDGTGRMSRSLARQVRDVMGLNDIPSAVQGRIGSAKGVWIVDIHDTTDDIWVETYPSQRKWVCGFDDPDHRTLEVRNYSRELRPAHLNLQFLPVLEDGARRAGNKAGMRQAIAGLLVEQLQKDLDTQKSAMLYPIQTRQWVHEVAQSVHRIKRIMQGKVEFLGGLPNDDEEVLNFLLDSGFDCKKQKYLHDMVWDLRQAKCETLKKKLKIRVGRSAYVYMVVDFWGLLEEDEIHLGFSSKFQDEDFSETLLNGIDVLVARSPAHYPSDIQKVKATFKVELSSLKDVIVFPRKGNAPLADRLSGGDYDGDMAWVCWDPNIVSNFANADVPRVENLLKTKYLGQNKTTLRELKILHGRGKGHRAVAEMIEQSFLFNMKHGLLGMCTNYKERLCYKTGTVEDPSSIVLSTLLSNLVDQAKQGIEFDLAKWDAFRSDLLRTPKNLPDPAYKGDNWTGRGSPTHIIDFLKFSVAKPAIDRELRAFHNALSSEDYQSWDPDLPRMYDEYKNKARDSNWHRQLMDALETNVRAVEAKWKARMADKSDETPFPQKVLAVHTLWLAIAPCEALAADEAALQLTQPFLTDPEESQWAMLRASTAFKLFYNRSTKFVWRMAGRQLAATKARMVAGAGSGAGVPVTVAPAMYAVLRPDARTVKGIAARREGERSEWGEEAHNGGEEDEDDA